MTYEVSYDENNRIVKIRIFGTDTKEDHCFARDEAVYLCRKYECSNLLVDLQEISPKLRNTPSCSDFGRSVAEKLKGIKIAHILPLDFLSKEDVRYISIVEQNRGVTNRGFNNIKEAVNWLIG